VLSPRSDQSRDRLPPWLQACLGLLILVALAPAPAKAQEGGVGPGVAPSLRVANRATVGKPARRQPGKAAGQPFIEFRSRYALSYGHTFVVFGRLNARGEIGAIKPEMVAGLHPAGEGSELWTLGHLTPVPAETGPSDGDLEEEYVSNRYRVLLNEAQYAELVAHIKQKRANSPFWHAALYNCNLWTGEIAQFLGLKTGFHWLPPAEFIGKIRELNEGAERPPSVSTTAPAPPRDLS
jgi:hypothetical protein